MGSRQIRFDRPIATRHPARIAAVSSGIAERFGRAMRARGVAMLKLLGAELGDVGGKLGIARRQARRAARHNGGRSRSRPRRCRPSPPSRRSARSPRQARSRRRSRSAGAAVGRTRRSAISALKRSRWRSSCRAMRGDGVRRGRILAQHGELPGIDARRAIFAGLVDAQHRRAVGARSPGARVMPPPPRQRSDDDRRAAERE